MDNMRKQLENIVLYKENKDGQDCRQMDHSNNRTIALLLAQDAKIKVGANSCVYMAVSAFRLIATVLSSENSKIRIRNPPHH